VRNAICTAICAKAAATGTSIEDAYWRLAGESALAWQEKKPLPFEYDPVGSPADDSTVTDQCQANGGQRTPPPDDQTAVAPTPTPAPNKTISAKPSSAFDEAVSGVWAYYIETIGRNPNLITFTPKRKAMGVARLRDLIKRSGSIESGVELMRLCVDRLKQSAFHNGRNDRHTKYLDWEILFRSTEQMEKWLDDERWTNVKGVA
jgi:hypothetical protein